MKDQPAGGDGVHEKWLFWACFLALIATAFGFIVRAMILNEWGNEFGLDETQKGQIQGVGLWPFAISIVLFSLFVDRIGYGKAMAFAFVCHVASAFITIYAKGYWSLYIGTFIVALGNGTVEAVINPVVATMFRKDKTKWLNILHAGWPGGLVIGGLIAIGMGETGWIGKMVGGAIGWQWKVALLLIPTMIYGLMMIGQKFPINERVAAGVSYRDMLKEAGIAGAFLVVFLIVREVSNQMVGLGVLSETFANVWVQAGMAAVISAIYGVYVRSLGRPMFIFLMLIMIPLATTELGTDSWIVDLMAEFMENDLHIQAGWILVYTSFIMMILRFFFAGPIVKKLTPLGLLATSSAIAAIGLVLLSKATGLGILFAATFYGFGKTFFWPTTLGVVAEQFPKGGALTLNMIAGVGMLGVGIVGAPLLGYIQDTAIESRILIDKPALHAQVIGADEKTSVLGKYRSVDAANVAAASAEDRTYVNEITAEIKKGSLLKFAILPTIMLICYLILIFYFKSKGGYQAEELVGHPDDEAKFTSAAEEPGEA